MAIEKVVRRGAEMRWCFKTVRPSEDRPGCDSCEAAGRYTSGKQQVRHAKGMPFVLFGERASGQCRSM